MKNYKVSEFLILETLTIKDALRMIESNKLGFIFVMNKSLNVIGLVTDGDIRRALLNGITINDEIFKCANKRFVRANIDTPRENLIKQLDNKIRFIPLLDDANKLISIFTKDNLPLREEVPVYVRARAPVRISFGGGGSDLTHYFAQSSGAVINAAISIYSHATMRIRDDGIIYINSRDLKESITISNIDEINIKDSKFGLIKSIIKVISPKFGFDLYLHSDFPVGSGLGGSATLSAAVLGCFNELRQDKWNDHEISEMAFEAERLNLGIAGGWQDQYAAVFGGFNFIEFEMHQNVINPLRINPDIQMELEESLVLCDTGILHNSGNIHQDQENTMSSEDIKSLVKENVKLTYKIKNLLLSGKLDNFGDCLNEAWKLKRNFSEKITNKKIDSIYEGAINNGALGGKLLGAGGGGFFIFYVPPFSKNQLLDYLSNQKLNVQPFNFDLKGLTSITSRKNKNHKLFKE
tara:strand:- start:15875 stop:17269 length:1395 start_codon:yes stop_codon:yes gene_type:complete